MTSHIFNPKKLELLNNPDRYKKLPPEIIIQNAELKNPSTIIDLGAGTGFYSIPFAKKFTACKVYACDISDVMTNWVKLNVVTKYNNIVAMQIDDNKIPLADGIADFVFMINLHHELSNPIQTLQECYRLINKNGKIAICDWKKKKSKQGPPLEIRCKPDEIAVQLNKVGFIVESINNNLTNNFLIIAKKAG